MNEPRPPTDGELLERYRRAGDAAAFRQLVERHAPLVFRSCRRALGGDVHQAEDAAQAVFVVLARKAADLKPAPSLAGWLFRTARFTVRQLQRAERRRRQREEYAVRSAREKRAGAQGETAWEEIRAELDEALAGLRRPQQEVVLLHYLEGRPLPEVAARLGCSPDAARKRAAYALGRLKELLARRGLPISFLALAAALPAEAEAAVPAGLAASCCAAAASGGLPAGSLAAKQLAEEVLKMLYWKKLQAALAYLAAGLGAAAGGAALVLGLFAAGAPGAGAATASPGMPRPSASAPAPSATPAADWTSPVRYPVVLDGWAFAQDEFNVLGNPLWRGRASREGEEIGVLIWQGQTHREAEERVGEISWREETGTGRVGFGTGTLSVRRGNSLLEEVELNQFLICQGENGGLRLDRHAATRWFTVVGPQGGARREPEAFADPAGEEILRGLLRAMLANPTPLFRGGMSEGTVSSLEAAVAGGPYIELAPTYTDGYGPGGWSVWVLQAHPGQAVSFRLWLAALRYRVTTAGIESGCEQAAMHGRRVWIGETEGRFTPAGPAELEIPALPGPERLTVSCEGVVYAPDAEPGTLGANPHTLGYIYLRWNRPEEEWLPTGRFPLAPRLPPEATPAAAVPIVLADLEAAYQPDLAGWFTTWGQPYVGQPEALALLPLADLDLAAYPHLAAARAAGRADWLVEAARGLALLDRNTEPAGPREALAARVAARLAEEGRSLAANQHLQPYTEEIPDGWHGTKKALWLALLWERFPGLREGNPLERVLDFWSAAIARNPAPAEDINNRERDRSPQTLARAVAALHLGGRALARPAWAQAGQAVLAELGRVFDEAAPEAKAEAAAWYGRAAALAGDQPALARVQRWLLTALAGDEAGFAAYRAAPFAARLGLLAVLRGRGDGLAPQEP